MEKRGTEKKIKSKKVWCIVGYAMVPVFFAILYLLMTETYEDIMQGNSEATMSVGGIINRIYNYIPRLGEFYQHIAVHFMTPQVSFGLDMIFRLITAAIASGTVYLSAMFIMGRKLRLEYKDVAICLSVLLLIMISIFSEAYTYRFSYANNYVLGLLVAVAFLMPFRMKMVGDKWWKIAGVLVLGFMFGISTELAPVAVLILIGGWTAILMIRRKIMWKELWGREYRLQLMAMVGLLAGLAFFYIGGGLGMRTGGGYASVYDYVSPMGVLHDPVTTVFKLMHHVWYNIRYVFFAIPMMGGIIFVEATIFKKEKEYLFWQIMLALFCILFVGATSLIAVHDDLYPRFMVPMFVAIVLSMLLLVRHILEYAKVPERTLKKFAIVTIALGGVLIVDTTFAFTLYKVTMAPKLEAIHFNPGGDLTIDAVNETTMIPSPIFNLKQLPPFDWGPAADYAKFGLGISQP